MPFTVDGRGVIRLGDSTTHGGKVIQVSSTTEVDDRPIARLGDLVSCPKCRVNCPIVEADPSYTDDGIPVALDGHKAACGAELISSLK